MNSNALSASPCGTLTPTIGGASAFVPDSLPPQFDMDSLFVPIASASMKLGELNGIGRTLANPYLLIRPLQRREAVASSNIEGTFTSLSDLFFLEAGADERARPADTREVLNYVLALEHAIARLEELPICLRLIREAHGVLLSGVRRYRGEAVDPGEFRKDQNWIGGPSIDQARFIPPPPNEVMPALGELEKFIQDPQPKGVPFLVHLALIHYQFETIHPFPDGNGRVGRLMIPLVLCAWGEMNQPFIYMSPFFARNRTEYVDRLFNVSKYGDWVSWIEFFLRGVIESSQETIETVRRLQDLNAEYKSRVQLARATALTVRLVDLVFEDPVITIPKAQTLLNTSYPTAKNHVDRLVRAGILREVDMEDLGIRRKYFVAHEIIRLLDVQYE